LAALFCCPSTRPLPPSAPVPYTTLFRSRRPSWRFALGFAAATLAVFSILLLASDPFHEAHVFWTRTVGFQIGRAAPWSLWDWGQDRKSTRLNSSHQIISYAVFCLKNKQA